MRPFEYASPATHEQAISLLSPAWGQAEILAGGTDLLAMMKDDVVHPKRLVNIKDIKELGGVTANAQGLRIGALTTMGELADNVNVAAAAFSATDSVCCRKMKAEKIWSRVAKIDITRFLATKVRRNSLALLPSLPS